MAKIAHMNYVHNWGKLLPFEIFKEKTEFLQGRKEFNYRVNRNARLSYAFVS